MAHIHLIHVYLAFKYVKLVFDPELELKKRVSHFQLQSDSSSTELQFAWSWFVHV